MKTRAAIFIVLCAAIWTGQAILDNRVQPQVSTLLSINALNGNDQDAANLLNSKKLFDWTTYSGAALTVLAAGLCFGTKVRRALGPRGN